jgi:Uncharacterized protein conserved in bacteria (DUF2188)
MSKSSQHVIHSPNGGWSVHRSGAAKATRTFGTQREAVDYARQLARSQGSDLYVHGRDGTVRTRDTFERTVARDALDR